MKLNKLYSLRKDFTVIGLTGRVGAGCSEIAKKLSDNNFNLDANNLITENTSDTEKIKINICANFLLNSTNWVPFKILHYRDVLLLHLFHEAIIDNHTIEEAIEKIIDIICQNGTRPGYSNRFKKDDVVIVGKIKEFLNSDKKWFLEIKDFGTTECNLNGCLSQKKNDPDFNKFYFTYFESLSKDFFELLNTLDITKRSRLLHDIAQNLRKNGRTENDFTDIKSYDHIYIVAETINIIIKNWRCFNDNKAKIVIDALKNSLELMFFKEKYSAFYMVATNKSDSERLEYVSKQIKNKYLNYSEDEIKHHVDEIINLDKTEYKNSEVNEGNFSVPDTENCIQKSDFHIYFSDDKLRLKEEELQNIEENVRQNKDYNYLSLDSQLVRLIALIHQPGIVTPTAIERTMQVAYNAKFNSGCISRQVGAVVTDKNFSIKAIGWNDVPQNQIPCNLRNANDLVNIKKNINIDHFSDFEKGEGDVKKYKDGKSFQEKFTDVINSKEVKLVDLEGKNCSYCFKSFHNAFEGEKNQVHTRSLHAEENAMMQIIKYGGQSLQGGNLFTTASPCELCSKKAFQLGIKNIFYIDPYPGISTKHILKSGIKDEDNPKLFMFQGAVGRAFHKLYEPFMAYKDELNILTGINPKIEFS
jgi:deoxycytidylate deaminase